jgi:hypothetical protein
VNGVSSEDPAIALLERLLVLSERNPDRTRPASVAPNYDNLRTAESISRFEARLLAAQKVGAVGIQKGIRERRHLIDRVRVKDPVALADHLGRAPARHIAQEMNDALAPVAARGEAWVSEALQSMIIKWSRGDTAHRLAVSDRAAAEEFLALLAAVSKDLAKGLDGRTFSLKVTGDSKAFDRHAARIAAVLAARFGEAGLAAGAIWDRIGLERFSHPVHVKGCVLAEDANGILVHGRAAPFASFHPELLPLLKLCGQPSAILTIENYATFNRYVREIDDEALVVYTGGFASAGTVELLKSLLRLADSAVPFFHWGDIDPGGLRIFRFLEEALPRRPRPHLMDRALAESHGRPALPDAALASIAQSDSAVAGLAEWLSRGDRIMHLEQEALDPSSPLSTTPADDLRHIQA